MAYSPLADPSPSRSARMLWVVDNGLVSEGEARVLAEQLARATVGPESQDLLRGLGRAEPRAIAPHHDWPGSIQALADCLGARADQLPWAAWSALADGLCPEPGSHWGFLDTGRLHMTPQQVRYLPLPCPDDPDWLRVLQAGLAEELPIALHRGQSGQLYLSSSAPLSLAAMHPSLLAEEHLPDVLPKGDSAQAWRKASQLASMLTYSWSSERGYPDALWLWGVCRLEPELALAPARPAPAGPAPGPLWLQGYCAAWSQQHAEPAPQIHWHPMPEGPAPGQDMLTCWSEHWRQCLEKMAAHAQATRHLGTTQLLIASLKTQSRLWSSRPEPPAVWQMGLGRAPGLRDLAKILSIPEPA